MQIYNPSTPGADTHTLMAFETQKKSTAVTYILWFFLGGVSAHRFYLGKYATAITQLLLSVVGAITVWVFGLGLLLLIPLGVWLLVDLFIIPGMVRELNTRLMNRLLGGVREPVVSP